MIKCYVKGGSFVKPFLRVDSMRSGNLRHEWLPQVASVASGLRWVDSLASRWNPPRPVRRSRKILISSQNFQLGRLGGFKVDSPVKRPDAGKLARSAPPYTDRSREEPWEGDHAVRPLRRRWQCRRGRPKPVTRGQRSEGLLVLYSIQTCANFAVATGASAMRGLRSTL